MRGTTPLRWPNREHLRQEKQVPEEINILLVVKSRWKIHLVDVGEDGKEYFKLIFLRTDGRRNWLNVVSSSGVYVASIAEGIAPSPTNTRRWRYLAK
jgi:hypothetical protein